MIRQAQSPQDVASILRLARLMHCCLLVSIPLYGVMGERLVHPEHQPLSSAMLTGTVILAISLVGLAFSFRIRSVRGPAEALRTNPTDQAMLGRWRQGLILTATLCEAVALLGLVNHMFGSSHLESYGFYALGAVLLLLWWPQAP